MHYLGGKSRTAVRIANYLESIRKPGQVYLEPFLGSANIMSHMSGRRVGSDIFVPIMRLWQAAQDGWLPPETVTEIEYNHYKDYKESLCPEMLAFVGIGCSFGGKLWGGYARDGKGRRDHTNEAYRGIIKKATSLFSVDLDICPYWCWQPRGWLIYCDPPYSGTQSYRGTPAFNHDLFWDIMRYWSKDNTVLISEYAAPSDFECVQSYPLKRQLAISSTRLNVVDRLFRCRI